jgi:Fic family protein
VAEYSTAQWSGNWSAPARRDQRSGQYRPYLPDPLAGRTFALEPDVAARAGRIEKALSRLREQPHHRGLENLAGLLLRAEAVASSRIEGLQVSPQQLALFELATREGLPTRSFTANAEHVARNVLALRDAVTRLADGRTLTREHITGLHRVLLPDDPHQGVRTGQNWIGGSDWHPLDAAYVPPPPERVPALLADLARYASQADLSPLVQAGVVHAQFETIHPFADGNGRVGRALIHTVLTRRGVTAGAVLPVSLVLLTRVESYLEGLASYRHAGDDADPAVNAWLRVFFAAMEAALDQAAIFAGELADLRSTWTERHRSARAAAGLRGIPRADSAVVRLLDALPESPVLTVNTVRATLGISAPAARNAADELVTAGILHARRVDRKTTGYLAREVFELVTYAERRLASTRWDTRESPPRRPVPYVPQA